MNLNKSTFIGNLGSDAIITEIQGKKAISFNVAVDQSYIKDEVKHEDTTWVNCTIWKKEDQSIKIAEYLKKGKKVYVSGRIKADAYQKDAQLIGSLKLQVDYLELLSVKEK